MDKILIMDYIIQMEKLFKFLELSLELEEKIELINIKKDFNNDLNLFGCFVKDFLTIENSGKISKDENIYNDFVICFDKYLSNNKSKIFINRFNSYSKHYLSIAFEETQDRILLSTIATVNSCFCLECYPILMEIMDDFLNLKIDRNSFALMLKFITDEVIKKFANNEEQNLTYNQLRLGINKVLSTNFEGRLAI